MTLGEFADAVAAGDLSSNKVEKGWKTFCDQLKELDNYCIERLISDGCLTIFRSCEEEYMFGTEGMSL